MDELPNVWVIWQSHSQPVNPSHVTNNELVNYITHNSLVDNSYIRQCHCCNSSLGQHTAENTTLLEALHMCNIVTEFYLYSIVYIFNK